MNDPIAEQATPDKPVVDITTEPVEKPAAEKPKKYNPAVDDQFIRDSIQPWTVNDMVLDVWQTAKRNLYLVADGTNKLVAITADYISVGGIGFKDISLSLNMGTTGENALDTGAAAANTWYAVWLITTSKGEKLACTAHLATNKATRNTTPTMPAGYAIARRIGMILGNATAAPNTLVIKSTQIDNWAWWYAVPATVPPGSLFNLSNQTGGVNVRIYDGTYSGPSDPVFAYYDCV